jgi:hypothetical protein
MSGFSLRLTKVLALCALVIAVLAAADQPAPSKKHTKATISDFEVDVDRHQVLVSFKLADAFDDNLKLRLDSGLATGIVFDFELVRRRRLWFNKTVAEGTLQVSAMFNAVSREYLVNFKHDGALIESRLVRSPEELYAVMSEFEDLAALSADGKTGDLVFRMRAVLGTGSLLFFIPTLRTTDWVETRVHVDRNGRLQQSPEESGGGSFP